MTPMEVIDQRSRSQTTFPAEADQWRFSIENHLVLFVFGYRFTTSDDLRDDGYTYSVGICTTAIIDSTGELLTAGAVQEHKPSSSQNDQRRRIIGSFEQAEIMSGSKYSSII